MFSSIKNALICIPEPTSFKHTMLLIKQLTYHNETGRATVFFFFIKQTAFGFHVVKP